MKKQIAKRPDAKKIIDTLVEAMQAGVEHFDDEFSLVPAEYEVRLHPDAYEEMKSIFPYIEERAEVQLNKALDQLNETGVPHLLRRIADWLRGFARLSWLHKAADASAKKLPPARYKHAGYGWSIRFDMTLDPEATLGYVAVVADLAAPQGETFAGPKTQRMTLRLPSGGFKTKTLQTKKEASPVPVMSDGDSLATRREPVPKHGKSGVVARLPVSGRNLAQLVYKDDNGSHSFKMAMEEITIGRGGEGHEHVHLQLKTVPDVSREHVRIRYLSSDRRFEIKDVSSYGTTVNGRHVPTSRDKATGQDLDHWEPLPEKSTISLAGVILIDFESVI